ncbi:DUF7472 family protein [Natranaeroarchaeum sulfidigenes]|uniref:Putative membrane protein n=1 Tax=Natranaeroarchaeum sulfidigenes TaxID=2784880 RepID=A0A897MZF2_9EURY|nr:hypothetical protein [Natranaeroarchaeum sulfidigenes]QSG04259.1 putative membrane protein [Natranaeroarchaeum sulfidigenes]
MDLERERVIEIVAAVGAVVVMIATMMWVGSTYATDGALTDDGGMLLVGSVIFFILLMAAVGVVLAYTVSAEDNDEDEDHGFD